MRFTPTILLASCAALSAAAPTTITLGEDDVILYGKGGRFTKMKRSDLEEIEAARNSSVVPPKPSYLDDSLYTVTGTEVAPSTDALAKRAGDTIIVPNPHQRFYGWDVLMT
jgi:hypothetical protein